MPWDNGDHVWGDHTWFEKIDGRYGIPFRCSVDLGEDAVYALAGKATVADGDVVALPGPLACYGVGVWRFWN